MRSKRLSELLRAVNSQPSFSLPEDPLILGIQYDSRHVGSGDIFVAIKGHKQDGHDYISDAIRQRAVAVVVEEKHAQITGGIPIIEVENGRKVLADLSCAFYENPTRNLFTVGVTGTKGKSSVSHMAASVLGSDETTLISTITNALERNVEQTTPEATTIQRIASEAVKNSMRNLVLETSAHALAQERVRGVDFNVGVFTNLSHDHLDYFLTREAYLDAKLKLFRNLGASATVVVNVDDPCAPQVIEATRAQIVRTGSASGADVMCASFIDGSRWLSG